MQNLFDPFPEHASKATIAEDSAHRLQSVRLPEQFAQELILGQAVMHIGR